jgi:outer membrane beta-barrel protein
MESRIQYLSRQSLALTLLAIATLLTAGFASLDANAATAEDLELEPLIVREPQRREVKIEKLDKENFEIGAYGGVMSIEDFGSDIVYGVRAAYHISEDFFVEASYGQSRLGLTSFERLSGGAQLLTDSERDLSFYNINVAVNILPGESFIASRWAFKGGLYLIGGIGSTEFGGDNRFTINGGLGYRFIASDWLALRVDVRDHVFKSDLLGASETKHNIEVSGGLTIFF